MTIHDNNKDRDNRMFTADNAAMTGHSSSTRNFSHASTYETQYRSTASNSSGHSRESSPSSIFKQNQPASPSAGYTSTTTRTASSGYRTETSPPINYTPQSSYRNVSCLFYRSKY